MYTVIFRILGENDQRHEAYPSRGVAETRFDEVLPLVSFVSLYSPQGRRLLERGNLRGGK